MQMINLDKSLEVISDITGYDVEQIEMSNKLIDDLGFDSIFIDSAKHVGWHDMGNYCGIGAIPDYNKMQYITHQIRHRTGRHDVAILAEKADLDPKALATGAYMAYKLLENEASQEEIEFSDDEN